jgi:sulfide dehydrogenase cytochrome subunit
MAARNFAFVFGLIAAAAISPALAQTAAPAGASSCSGCHGASAAAGTAVPPLQGRPADDIVRAMADFRTGKRNPTVMDRIAKGFSDGEARAIAAWLAAQR